MDTLVWFMKERSLLIAILVRQVLKIKVTWKGTLHQFMKKKCLTLVVITWFATVHVVKKQFDCDSSFATKVILKKNIEKVCEGYKPFLIAASVFFRKK